MSKRTKKVSQLLIELLVKKGYYCSAKHRNKESIINVQGLGTLIIKRNNNQYELDIDMVISDFKKDLVENLWQKNKLYIVDSKQRFILDNRLNYFIKKLSCEFKTKINKVIPKKAIINIKNSDINAQVFIKYEDDEISLDLSNINSNYYHQKIKSIWENNNLSFILEKDKLIRRANILEKNTNLSILNYSFLNPDKLKLNTNVGEVKIRFVTWDNKFHLTLSDLEEEWRNHISKFWGKNELYLSGTLSKYNLNNQLLKKNNLIDCNNKVNIYTDGSFVEGVLGCGIVIVKDNKVSKKLGFNNLEYKKYESAGAELLGIIKALDWCKENNIKRVNLHYDFSAITRWIHNQYKGKNPLVKELKRKYKNINTIINWCEVKAHSGNPFHNQADKLAREKAYQLKKTV